MISETVTVVDYGAGNVGSVMNMLKKIGVLAIRAQCPEQILSATRLLLPGVGAFDHCMRLLEQSGLKPALEEMVLDKKIPVLGICVGFQMMFSRSEEGALAGLGWMQGEVIGFDRTKLSSLHKIPHMGWDVVQPIHPHALFSGMENPRYYFVHSYHAFLVQPENMLATCNYGYDFCCAAQQSNIIGVQFHPEKSHRYGMQLLKNFANGSAI